MLDTNTLDFIYNKKTHLVPKLRNLSKKHIHLYITHIQQDEINKMTDDKKNCINKIISIIGIKRVLSSCAIIGIDEPSNHGFIGPNIGMYELVDDDVNLPILEKFYKYTDSNPMGNAADLSIIYTAIKKKMNYLITDDNHFGPLLQKISKFMSNDLQVQKKLLFRVFIIE